MQGDTHGPTAPASPEWNVCFHSRSDTLRAVSAPDRDLREKAGAVVCRRQELPGASSPVTGTAHLAGTQVPHLCLYDPLHPSPKPGFPAPSQCFSHWCQGWPAPEHHGLDGTGDT